ncbi:MAG: HAD family hydrolase [Myxococcales bacterium]|jgi:HAD superfamily hydrolase (TIGR01509 family)
MAVIFDCDGVLVDSERLVSRIEAKLFRRWGWEVSPEELGALLKGRGHTEVVRIIESHLPVQPPADWIYEWAMHTAIGFRRALQPVEGVRGVLDTLAARDVPVAVASQSSHGRVLLSLELCRLSDYFGDHVYTASMVRHPKPAPDIYLHAARQLGAAPDRCTVIEDSVTGVRSAVAAGMRVLGYAADADADALQQAGAEVFERMEELAIRLDATPAAPKP